MTQIVIENARLAFPSLYTKAMFDGKETKYEGTLIIDKDNPAIAKLQAEIKKVLADKLKVKVLPAEKICLKDGDLILDKNGNTRAEFEGKYSLKASSNNKPRTVGLHKEPLEEDDGTFYAGCYVNAIVDLWGQDNKFGKRVNCNLLAVQFVKDGDPLGSASLNLSALPELELSDDVPF